MTGAQQRQCPTRTDGQVALFTHRVTANQCQSRQRGHFHRCHTCAYNNAYVAQHGPPAESEEPAPAEAPEQKGAGERPKSAAARA